MDYDRPTNYIVDLIKEDKWMMDVLRVVQSINLPDWWIGAGFVRNKVWDTLHNFEKKTTQGGIDVDVIYFDPSDISESSEQELELKLYSLKPGVPWSVKNQARMHLLNEDKPYSSSEQALSQWVETATCVGAKLDQAGQVVLTAPWGVEDVVNMVLRPNPHCRRNPQSFILRLQKKDWLAKWPKLKVFYE